MWTEIKKLLITVLWPVIKELLKKAVRELLEWMIVKMKEMAERRNANNAATASSKAQTSEDMAGQAKTKEEAEKHAAIAKVWREVAEMFRQENEGMKQELDELRAKGNSKADSAVAMLSFDEAIDAQSDAIKAVEGGTLLKLDSPSAK